MPRDEFPTRVKRVAARRVGDCCSNPRCQRITSGPAADPERATNIGVAAHIKAASPGGPRYDPSMSPGQRAGIENAIWLCQTCATLIDHDIAGHPVSLLHEWKLEAVSRASGELRAPGRFRSIAAGEVRQEQTIPQLAAVRALEAEFGCHVETDVHVPAGDGWLHLDGAVVRGEDLIAIEIREHHGKGLAYFQVEYLFELCTSLKFARFQSCTVYCAIVSDGPMDADGEVRTRLEELAKRAGVEAHVRLYRLNELRARYGL